MVKQVKSHFINRLDTLLYIAIICQNHEKKWCRKLTFLWFITLHTVFLLLFNHFLDISLNHDLNNKHIACEDFENTEPFCLSCFTVIISHGFLVLREIEYDIF